MDPYIKGRLAEDGQTMDFPIVDLEAGTLKPFIKAGYHVHTVPAKDYEVLDNLLYLAVPKGTIFDFGERIIPIPLKDSAGNIIDKIHYTGSSYINCNGFTVAKIHPGTPFKVKMPDRTSYHSFEILETPLKYKNIGEMALDYVQEDDHTVVCERMNRIISLPGVILYPDYSARHIPGWLCRASKGSPELGFGYSLNKEPRPGEILHYHRQIMEPTINVDGKIKLFLAGRDGSDTIKIRGFDGNLQDQKGEILTLQEGDVIIPMPLTRHKILYDGFVVPQTYYTINYARQGLDLISSDERVPLERII